MTIFDKTRFPKVAPSLLALGLGAIGAQFAQAADNTPPSVPANLRATSVKCGEVTLAWNASTDDGGSAVRGYRIFRSGSFVTEVAAASLTFTDTAISSGATYSYAVAATDTSGNESLPSSQVQVVTLICDDFLPPSVPGNLVVTPVDCGAISLNWSASLDRGGAGVRGYRITRNGVFVTEVPASSTTFMDSGLSPSRTYSYRVSAKDRANNESVETNAVQATTPPCDDLTPPTAPTGLRAAALNCGEVMLTWNASTDVNGAGVRGYRILRNGVFITEVAAPAVSFVDAGLSPSRSYSYVITAKDKANNESPDSNPAPVTTPACDAKSPPTVPTGLTATPASCGQIDLRWSASTDVSGAGLRGYRILRNGGVVAEVAASVTAFSDVGVSAATRYAYTILAVDKAGNESRPSSPANITSPPCPLVKGDFDLDRNTDIILQHADGSVAFWFMQGTTLVRGFVPFSVPSGWQIVGTSDFSHDDQTDVVLQHADRSVAFWLMSGTSIQQGIIPFQVPVGVEIVATGDFDGDLQDDLVVQDGGGRVAFWFMNGTTGVGADPGHVVPAGWRVAGTGHFNDDDYTDIVLQHTDGSVAFWLMQGTQITAGIVPVQVPVGWQIVAAGAFNSDKSTDLLLQHADGSVAFWLMDGVTIAQGVHLPYRLPAGWKIGGPK